MTLQQIPVGDAAYLLGLWREGRDEQGGISALEQPLPVDEQVVSRLNSACEAVVALKRAHEGTGLTSAKFDGEAAVTFHRNLAPLPASVEGNYGFWRWVALAKFYEVIEWRHPREGGAHPQNYGVGRIVAPESTGELASATSQRSNIYPWRLWMRGSLVYEPDERDPYALARRGTVDFWESGLIRVRYSSCRPLARAFVRYQWPDDSGNGRLSLDGTRTLYKRLRRLQATMAFELLDDDEAYALLEDLGDALERA